MPICQYKPTHTKEDYVLRKKVLICNKKECKNGLYKNLQEIQWGGEVMATICKTKAKVEKIIEEIEEKPIIPEVDGHSPMNP